MCGIDLTDLHPGDDTSLSPPPKEAPLSCTVVPMLGPTYILFDRSNFVQPAIVAFSWHVQFLPKRRRGQNVEVDENADKRADTKQKCSDTNFPKPSNTT